MAYRYSEQGGAFPSGNGYIDSTGYYGGSKDIPMKAAPAIVQSGGSFEPIRTYSSQVVRSPAYPRFNWHMLRTAVAAMICCPFFCGVIGLVYAILSYTDFHKDNMKGYHSKKNCSLGWSIAGLILGVMGVLASIIIAIIAIANIALLYRYGYYG